MFNEIDAVIFDLDGTVIDSMWLWESIDVEYLGRFQIPFEKSYQQDIEGMSFNETAVYFKERFNIPDSIEQMKQDWNRMAWDKYCNEVLPKPGVVSFLEKLQNNGIKTGIGTSNSTELCQAILKVQNLIQYFDVVHTANEVPKGKPSPDIYLLVAKNLGVDPGRCLVFEDLCQGIQAGINAGMKTCAVEDPYSAHTRDRKIELADYFITDFTDERIINWR